MEVMLGLTVIVGGAWAFLRILSWAFAIAPRSGQGKTLPVTGGHRLAGWGGQWAGSSAGVFGESILARSPRESDGIPFSPYVNIDGTPMMDEVLDVKGRAFGSSQ